MVQLQGDGCGQRKDGSLIVVIVAEKQERSQVEARSARDAYGQSGLFVCLEVGGWGVQ